ncbi:APC family permease [Janibacter cremeus]|uniref:APA family basic amino acid/polyamine antiporter n=1 Tax=Janibacter cremeus TaxID=1285192 RepID=A0A852VVP5_9MICO|nr:APC family permease [Janibacter cremeus]NYF99480.1 APA family basic amino acid/polyamine antiporter [Janibacter cremeus]
MTNSSGAPTRPLDRRLGLRDGVALGLAAMIGAGLFSAFAPAAASAGRWLALAVVIAAAVASANAHSMARLAARYPHSGGAYVYGRERLGVPWGHLAGWAFVVGKVASCAAMAMTLAVHVWPNFAKPIAVVVVLAVLALNLQGVQRSARVAFGIVALVMALVVTFGLVMLVAPPVTVDTPPPAAPGSGTVIGVIQGAGFLFFAFAGYARVATLGEEITDPRRTIPRAIGIALVIVLALYTLVAVALTSSLGAGWVAAREAPLAEAAEISSWPWLGPALRVAAVLAAGGALLALVLGASRTLLAMARDRHLPPALAVVDGPHGTPRRAEAVIAGLVIMLIVLVDLRGAIGFSSFLVLTYYAIANASALTLERRPAAKIVPTLGLVACVVVAVLMPWQSVVAGVVILSIGAFIGWARYTTREGPDA